jgi:Tfp pilus assembly protein PilX
MKRTPLMMRLSEERGIAMVTALLVAVVVLALGLVALQLAQHNVSSSAFDRKRVQAVAAAEAGIDDVYARIQNATPAQLPCASPVTGSLAMSPSATYSVTVTYYDAYPPGAGNEIDCGDLVSKIYDIQQKQGTFSADITSVGTAVGSGSPNSVSRRLQTEVQLAPQTAFQKAIFSNAAFGTSNLNHFTLNGNNGPNGNIYTNGDFGCNNNSSVQGSVYAQGSATVSNTCSVAIDLWAGGNVSLSGNSNIGNNVISSLGNITISNPATVNGSAKAAGSCTGCAGRVAGSIVTGARSPMPPKFLFPALTWGTGSPDYQALFQEAGYALDFSRSNCNFPNNFTVTQDTAFVINGNCSFSGSTFQTANRNVAFIVKGSVSLAQKTLFANTTPCNPTTQPCPFVSFIVPSNYVPGFTQTTPCPSPYNTNGAYDVSASNNKDFTGINVFVYTPCNVNFNNNSSSWYGQIYAGNQANIQNLYTQNYQQMPLFSALAPIVGFTENIVFLREIAA